VALEFLGGNEPAVVDHQRTPQLGRAEEARLGQHGTPESFCLIFRIVAALPESLDRGVRFVFEVAEIQWHVKRVPCCPVVWFVQRASISASSGVSP
jgi:hypothetical protein